MFRPLSDFVPKAVNHLGMTKQVTGAHVCQAFRAICNEIIHESADEHIHPRFFRNGVLSIGVDASAWAQLVTDKKVTIIEILNKRIGSEIIKNIRTSLHEKTQLDAPQI